MLLLHALSSHRRRNHFLYGTTEKRQAHLIENLLAHASTAQWHQPNPPHQTHHGGKAVPYAHNFFYIAFNLTMCENRKIKSLYNFFYDEIQGTTKFFTVRSKFFGHSRDAIQTRAEVCNDANFEILHASLQILLETCPWMCHPRAIAAANASPQPCMCILFRHLFFYITITQNYLCCFKLYCRGWFAKSKVY